MQSTRWVFLRAPLLLLLASLALPNPIAATPTRPQQPTYTVGPGQSVLHLHGRTKCPSYNALGLFNDASSTEPLKAARVDARGNYFLDVDLARDLHPLPYQPGKQGTCLRFFLWGQYQHHHGFLDHIVYDPATRQLLFVVMGPNRYDESSNTLEFSEDIY